MHNRCSHKCLAPQTHRGPKSASLSVWEARPHGTQHTTQQPQPSPLLTKHYRIPAGPTTTAFVMQRAGHDRCMEGAPHGMQRTWHVCGACCCGPRSHWGAGGAAAVISCGCIALPRSETARHHEAEFALPIEEEEEEEPLCIDSPLCPGP